MMSSTEGEGNRAINRKSSVIYTCTNTPACVAYHSQETWSGVLHLEVFICKRTSVDAAHPSSIPLHTHTHTHTHTVVKYKQINIRYLDANTKRNTTVEYTGLK